MLSYLDEQDLSGRARLIPVEDALQGVCCKHVNDC